jgi:hypothetical protein
MLILTNLPVHYCNQFYNLNNIYSIPHNYQENNRRIPVNYKNKLSFYSNKISVTFTLTSQKMILAINFKNKNMERLTVIIN